MTRLQFISLLTPAIGSFVLVILAWMHSNSRLSDLRTSVSERFESLASSMNQRFDEINRRFEEVDRRFQEVDRRFEEVNRRLGLIESDQKQFYSVTGRLDGRLAVWTNSPKGSRLGRHSRAPQI